MSRSTPPFRLAVVLGSSLALAFAAAPANAQTAAEKAAVEYQKGKEAFQARDFEGARGAFERAYMLDPSPVLLYNLGRACEESGDAEKAIEYFQMYLDRTADTPDRGDVERRVRVMQAILSKTKPEAVPDREPEPPPPPAPEPSLTPAPRVAQPASPPPHTVLWPIGWASLGAGVVAAGVGIGFGIASSNAEEDHKAATTGAEKKRTADDAESAATMANVMYATGGVLVAAGVTMLIIDARRGPEAKGAPTAVVTPEGAFVGWGGRF
jgi:tetratricopeptide (TPR) repeat protein